MAHCVPYLAPDGPLCVTVAGDLGARGRCTRPVRAGRWGVRLSGVLAAGWRTSSLARRGPARIPVKTTARTRQDPREDHGADPPGSPSKTTARTRRDPVKTTARTRRDPVKTASSAATSRTALRVGARQAAAVKYGARAQPVRRGMWVPPLPSPASGGASSISKNAGALAPPARRSSRTRRRRRAARVAATASL